MADYFTPKYISSDYCINELTKLKMSTCPNKYDDQGRLLVKDGDVNLYGETRVSMRNSIVQNYAPYGMINTQQYEKFTASGGTIQSNQNGCEIDLSITSSLYSYAVIRSSRVIKYRPAYNNIVRFNTVFNSPVTNSLQFGGVGNNSSDLYFCYSGIDFGVRLSTGGQSEVRTLTIVTANNNSSNATVVLNGVSYTVPLTNAGGNTAFTAMEIAKFSGFGSIWNTENISNTVIFQAKDVGSKSGAYSVTPGGGSALVTSFSQSKAGAVLNTTFIPRTQWNGDSVMITSLNPLKRNMYGITYSWYGSGNILFQIYNPDTSAYETVHSMKFANDSSGPSMTSCNMYVQNGIASLGSTTAMTLRTAGLYGTCEGSIDFSTQPTHGKDNMKSILANTPTIILALKNRQTINGYSNQSEMLIEKFSCFADGNKSTTIKIIRNPTSISASSVADYINWQYINITDSVGLTSTTANTFTGGIELDVLYLGKTGNLHVDLSMNPIHVYKDDVILFVATSSNISEVGVACSIIDDV